MTKPVPADKKLNEARQLSQAYNFPLAVLAYEKLTHVFPHRAAVWFEYGCAAGGAGQFDLADDAWHKALDLEPSNGELMLQIGHRYQTLRQPEKARASV